MKNIAVVFGVGVLLLLASCSEKFNIAAPYKNISVINCFLDAADTAHYVRIQKAFLDQNTSAVTMAQVPDSSYYSSLNVCIKRFDFDYNYIDSIHLYRVDLNKEGYSKNSGTFFQYPNYAYKFTNALNDNYIYRVVVTNLATHNVDSSESPVINDVDNSEFRFLQIDDTTYTHGRLDFSNPSLGQTLLLTGSYTPNGNFSFKSMSSPAYVADVVFRFNWTDSDALHKVNTAKYYDYDLGYYVLRNNKIAYTVKHSDMFNALAVGMGKPANSYIYRLLGAVKLIVYLSTSDYYTYEQIGLTQGTGLTGSEVEPVYSNIKGADVLGLFTARASRTGTFAVTDATFDSLYYSKIINPACNLVGTKY
jgi:hypothetical protein